MYLDFVAGLFTGRDSIVNKFLVSRYHIFILFIFQLAQLSFDSDVKTCLIVLDSLMLAKHAYVRGGGGQKTTVNLYLFIALFFN